MSAHQKYGGWEKYVKDNDEREFYSEQQYHRPAMSRSNCSGYGSMRNYGQSETCQCTRGCPNERGRERKKIRSFIGI